MLWNYEVKIQNIIPARKNESVITNPIQTHEPSIAFIANERH